LVRRVSQSIVVVVGCRVGWSVIVHHLLVIGWSVGHHLIAVAIIVVVVVGLENKDRGKEATTSGALSYTVLTTCSSEEGRR
jgi:hypothetical protein